MAEDLLNVLVDSVDHNFAFSNEDSKLSNTIISIASHLGHFRESKITINDPLAPSHVYIPSLNFVGIIDTKANIIEDYRCTQGFRTFNPSHWQN